RCPHQGGPLCEGRLAGRVAVAAPGEEIQHSRAGEILCCPWHSGEADIRTGQAWFNQGRVRVRAYGVAVEAGEAGARRGRRRGGDADVGGVGGEEGAVRGGDVSGVGGAAVRAGGDRGSLKSLSGAARRSPVLVTMRGPI